MDNLHCIKYCNFTKFPGVKILGKGTVSAEFQGCTKLCRNCVFPQNFYTTELGKITVFFAVLTSTTISFRLKDHLIPRQVADFKILTEPHNWVYWLCLKNYISLKKFCDSYRKFQHIPIMLLYHQQLIYLHSPSVAS